MRLWGNISPDSGPSKGQGYILFHDDHNQLTDTELTDTELTDTELTDTELTDTELTDTSARVTLTTFESAVFDGGAQNSLTDELVFTVCSIPRCVRDWHSHDIIPTAMRNEKTVVTNFTKCVIVAFWRHNVWPFRGIWVSKQVHSRTFLQSTRSWKSDFGFSFSAPRLHR